MKIRPAKRIRGRLRLPGDKSISHRAAIICSFANGPSKLSNFSSSRDCASTLSCLRQLGVLIEQNGPLIRIDGAGPRGFRPPNETLDCGNSGSTLRMLAGVLAGRNIKATLTGDDSLRERPMQRIIVPLEIMGARLESNNGKPPLTIEGASLLRAITYELPVASAQVKSSILFAALSAQGHTAVVERLGATRDHTERLLKYFGAPVHVETSGDASTTTTTLDGPVELSGRDVNIPGDISSAAFLIAAAALLKDSELEIESVGLNPTRTQFLETLRSAGFTVDVANVREDCGEPAGTILTHGQSAECAGENKGRYVVEDELIPQLIDELPLLAVVGSQIDGGIEFHNAEELRFKESDRIAAMVTNLKRMGGQVEEFDDGLRVEGPTQLCGARLEAFGDHRIAMALSVAAVIAEGDSEIEGFESVDVSFPEFFEVFESVIER